MYLDANEIKEVLTIEDITKIVVSLGSNYPKPTNNTDVIIFNTVCHNKKDGSYKLYYLNDKKYFTCFTQCSDSFDIYELIKRNKSLYGIDMDFYETVKYVANITGLQVRRRRRVGFGRSSFLIDDWDFINGYDVKDTQQVDYIPIPESYLDCYDNIYHQSWIDDGISIQTMKRNNIKYCVKDHQIIIPHYHGVTGDLIGIRCRNLMPEPLAEKKKYMPVYLQGKDFSHALSGNLYGLYKNRETIKRLRKVMIVESEKGVMQCETIYGNNNFTVATCSSNITNIQRDLLLDCDIDEVILAPDKDFPINSKDYAKKMKTICKLAKKFTPYVRVYVIEDSDDLLELKDSPTDKGQEILEQLMKNKVGLTMDMINSILKGEW